MISFLIGGRSARPSSSGANGRPHPLTSTTRRPPQMTTWPTRTTKNGTEPLLCNIHMSKSRTLSRSLKRTCLTVSVDSDQGNIDVQGGLCRLVRPHAALPEEGSGRVPPARSPTGITRPDDAGADANHLRQLCPLDGRRRRRR